LWKVVEDRKITINLRTNLIEVLPDTNQAVFENLDKPGETTTTEYEMLHVTPPMSAPDVLVQSKNLVTTTGYLDVSKTTLQHTKFENIFGIGDCSASPNSKTAASVGKPEWR
jgi:eukaryotic sulfide quinone oxidoreductase